MTKDRITNEYFEWLYHLACGQRFAPDISYRKLLMHLHSVPFRYSIKKDINRAADGLDLRDRFAYDYTDVEGVDMYLDGPCSVLEMMIGLALRCDEEIMDDPILGDRTRQWFWNMIVSLGLGSMVDYNYNKQYTEETIQRFLDRKYEPNGKGGLFTIRNCDSDLRKAEIWHQLCWYLDSIMDMEGGV